VGAATLLLVIAAGALWRWATRPTPQSLRLPDGTEAFFLSGARVTPADSYPRPRQIGVDGDVFFRVTAAPQPLTVRSRLLVLTVSGKTAFRITAHSRETGEQVEVLYGHVEARKSYDSPYPEPDTLRGGQMVMVNETIDLQEKENFDPAALRAWKDGLIASAQPR
jgi:hypothetical protein